MTEPLMTEKDFQLLEDLPQVLDSNAEWRDAIATNGAHELGVVVDEPDAAELIAELRRYEATIRSLLEYHKPTESMPACEAGCCGVCIADGSSTPCASTILIARGVVPDDVIQ